MWPNNTLDQTARHEAGHAIARSLLAIPYSHVEVISPTDARVVSGADADAKWLPELPAEYTVTDAVDVAFDISYREDLLDFSVATAAGPIAQMRYEGWKPENSLDRFSWFGGPGDARLISKYALVLAGTQRETIQGVVEKKDELVERILGVAMSLVDDNCEWIESVAIELETTQTLERDEVEALRPDPADCS